MYQCKVHAMLVQFIGGPCSGKTTTAAKLFATLKEQGHPCEFVAERARAHIAKVRRRLLDSGQDPSDCRMTEDDQLAILEDQLRCEEDFVKTCPKQTIVVADGCPLNSLLYLAPELRERINTKSRTRQAICNLDVVFRCQPVDQPASSDPNRIHSAKECAVIDGWIPEVIPREALDKCVLLAGPIQLRHDVALAVILQELWRRIRG